MSELGDCNEGLNERVKVLTFCLTEAYLGVPYSRELTSETRIQLI